MSLINQMLRDLQQQKKPGGPAEPEVHRVKMLERIPYLPLPLVLGGAALALVVFVWWLAGALSDKMFGPEPTGKPAVSAPLVAEQPMAAAAEPDQLTRSEREAEAPAAPVVQAQAAEKAAEPVEPQVAPAPVVAAAPVESAVAVAAEPAPAPVVKRKPEPLPKRATSVSAPARSTPGPVPHKVAATTKRLRPEDLPGAISSSSRLPSASTGLARPSRTAATTPYGMAEEAFLDGKWALEQGHPKLAVKSLQEALEFYPGHLPARELLVEILGKDGKSGEAMYLLAEGLDIAPDYIAFRKAYARMLADQGDYDTAIKVMLSGGLPAAADDPEAYVLLATLYQRLGEPFLTAQTYRNLLVAWPQTGAFWVGLGSALEGQNLPQDAVECYRRALATKNLRQDLGRFAEKRLQQLN